MPEETGIILPAGVAVTREAPRSELATVVNETELPDGVVMEAVETYFEENASMLGVNQGNTSFQGYATSDGSLLARQKYRTPSNVIEEICLARDLAERDDDVSAAIGSMQAIAYSEGMAHSHPDEVVEQIFDEIGDHTNLDLVWHELYREWLIAGQVNTACAFTREDFQFTPDGADRQRTRSVVAPLIGVLPAEQIRIVGNDLFRTGVIALRPASARQESWLREFFASATTPARKAEMRAQDPMLAQLVVEQLSDGDPYPNSFTGWNDDQAYGTDLYRLNPRMVHRTTMAKGAWPYPRPPLTRDFALLEAKRLLNLMDYALLQGGSNFLVIAKKGSDQKPALPEEIRNLREQISRASRTGVMIGDHRLNIEVITPDLKELLSPEKRKLLGRKLANSLLRVPEQDEDSGGEGQKARIQLIQRVIGGDRRLLKRHVERGPYREIVRRNSTIDKAAKIWFSKIILEGTQYFTDYVLKSRDRGDISRHTAVEIGGFDYDAEVRKRRLEKSDDRIMTPAAVPFSSPNAPGGGGPQDNQPGRPVGSSPNNGRGTPTTPPAQARPRQVIGRVAGETVTARYEEEYGSYRIGDITYAILEQYHGDHEIGRVTQFERQALDQIADGETAVLQSGATTVVPVNTAEELDDVRAVRLSRGVGMLIGTRDDGAVLARALTFREPEYSVLDAQETALRWGYSVVPPVPEEQALTPREATLLGQAVALLSDGGDDREQRAKRIIQGVIRDTEEDGRAAGAMEIHVHADGGVKRKRIKRGANNEILEIEDIPPDAD